MKKYESERAEGATDEQFALGCQVRSLRDEGVPWWAIAKDLKMEGAGDSATTGKKGAARARQAYAKAFGSHPRTFTKGKKAFYAEKNEHVAKVRETKQADRIAKVKKGKGIIKKKMSDEEVMSMLSGRVITWMIQLDGDNPQNDSAGVHPRGMRIYFEPNGDRAIEFREIEKGDKAYGLRGLPGRYRCVRLKAIHSVR